MNIPKINPIRLVLIIHIAIGLVLSLIVSIQYECVGNENFPIYFGSPFIYKQTSLASSMEYYYSILGLVLNIACWSFVLYLVDYFIKNRLPVNFYKVIVFILFLFSFFNITIDIILRGNGFDKNRSYWYWNVDDEAKNWGMICEGNVYILKIDI